jgi:hypothetical protein
LEGEAFPPQSAADVVALAQEAAASFHGATQAASTSFHAPAALGERDRRRLLVMAYLALAFYGRASFASACGEARSARTSGSKIHYAWGIMRQDAAYAPGGTELFTRRSDVLLKGLVPCPWQPQASSLKFQDSKGPC